MGGGSPAVKYVSLSNDEREIRWRDEKESSSYSSVTLNSIRDVTMGWESDVFAAIPDKEKPDSDMSRPWFCFSIICEDRSLDLSVKDGSLQRREDVTTRYFRPIRASDPLFVPHLLPVHVSVLRWVYDDTRVDLFDVHQDVITWVRGLMAILCSRPGSRRQAPTVQKLKAVSNTDHSLLRPCLADKVSS